MIKPFRGYITNQFAPFLALRLRQIHRAGDAVDGLTSLGRPGPSCVNEYYVSLKIHVTLQKTNMKLSSKKYGNIGLKQRVHLTNKICDF